MYDPPVACRSALARTKALLPLVALLAWAGCSDELTGPKRTDPVPAPPAFAVAPAPTAWYLVGAGDISTCTTDADEATAKLLDGVIAGRGTGDSVTIFTAGDNVYDNGTAAEYANCYDPTWGRHRIRTRPVMGNHEYNISSTPSFDYFNGIGNDDGPAGPRDKGYFSYDLGTWHIIVLNDNIPHDVGSAQEQWLRADLAGTTQRCVAALFHKPRFYSTFSSTDPGLRASARALWVALYEAGTDFVLNGHQHYYDRFSPQDPDGRADTVRGIRQFIVGTGGVNLSGTPTVRRSHSVVRQGTTHGILKLTLGESSYTWEFQPIAGKTFTDRPAGPKGCYGRNLPPPPPPQNNAPTAAFAMSCVGRTCTYTDQSTDSDGSVASWRWDFGDATSSTTRNPTHSYKLRGTYTTVLRVTDNLGAVSDPASRTVTILISLQARLFTENGVRYGRLTWSGARTAIDVYRNNIKVAIAVPNTGSYVDRIGTKSGVYTYRVCDTELTATEACSNTSTVRF
jgi:hypothetical protein